MPDPCQLTPAPRPRGAGTVSLVGAGPGDPELLTVQAIKAIRRASVLLVDDLVGAGVLRYARRSARIIPVGKRGGAPTAVPRGGPPDAGRPCVRHSTPQDFIHRLMVAEAQRGETVVRLKGGDPFIFGRGGEEAEHLRRAGIEVRIVNGISSGLAASTALGVPWTHREHAQGVLLVTGHAGDAGSELYWPALAAAVAQRLTLVVYMGVQRLEHIRSGLLPTLGALTPAALVQRASTAQERSLVTTLGRLSIDAARAGIGSPAILIVGDVLKGVQAARDTVRLQSAPSVSDERGSQPAHTHARISASGGSPRR